MLGFVALLAAAPSPVSALDTAARDIDEALAKNTTYAISASKELTLEGSAGEAYVDEGSHIQKVTMTFYGETYRSDLVVYVRDGQPFRVERVTGRTHERVYLTADTVVAAVGEGGKKLDNDIRDELVAMARALIAPVAKCLSAAAGKAARCDSVGAVFDAQSPDEDLRVALIKREVERTRGAKDRYTRFLLENYSWNMTGMAYVDGAKLRLLELTVAGEPAQRRHLEFYYGGPDLLMSVDQRRTAVIRVYYRDGKPLRILDGRRQRIPVNDASQDTFVMTIIEYATTIAPCFSDVGSRRGCPTMTPLPAQAQPKPTKRPPKDKPLPPLKPL